MEQNHAQEDVADGSAVDRSAADQQRRDAEHADLGVGAVSGDIAHVLKVDHHAEAGEYRGHDHGDDTGALNLDAGVACDVHILADGAHVLAELGLAEPDDEEAENPDDQEGENRDLDASHAHGEEVIEALAHVQQGHRVAHAVTARQLDGGVLDGDDRTHHVQHDQLIDAVHEIADDVAGDHLAALRHVQDLAAEITEQHGDGDRENHRQHHAGDPPDLPVGDQDQSDLSGHGAERHAEVQAHTGHDRDQQAEDQENVAPHTGDDFVDQVAGGEPGERDADRADQHKHQRDGVVLDKSQYFFAETLVVHFVPSVFLVSA